MTTQTDSKAIRARMNDLFARLCASMGVKAYDFVPGNRSHATFATDADARKIADLLKTAGEKNIDVYHWDPSKDPDFTRDEYQVSWGI